MRAYIDTLVRRLWRKAHKNTITVYDNRGQEIPVKNDAVTLEISTPLAFDFKGIGKSLASMTLGSAAAAILPSLITISTRLGKSKMKQWASQFMKEYECSASGHGFYSSKKINLPLLTLKRKVQVEQSDLEASMYKFIPEMAPDGSAFRFKLDEYLLKYSKARTTADFNKLKFKFEIEFSAVIINAKKEWENKVIGVSSIETPLLPFNDEIEKISGQYYTGWFPLIPPQVDSKEITSLVKNELKEDPGVEKQVVDEVETTWQVSGWTTKIKKTTLETIKDQQGSETYFKTVETKTTINKIIDGSGNFAFTISVREANPFQVSAEGMAQFFEDNEDDLNEGLKFLLTKKGGETV